LSKAALLDAIYEIPLASRQSFSQIFSLLKVKYLTPENTKSGFLFTKFSKSFSTFISVIETFLYFFDKIFKISFSSNIIPTLS